MSETNSISLTESEQEFLGCFHAGDVSGAKRIANELPSPVNSIDYSAHRLLRAFVDSNSGHCHRKTHLQIAELLIQPKVIAFRDAVLDDSVAEVQEMIGDDPKLIHAEFTAGRGIAQAVHHFCSAKMAGILLDAGADIDSLTSVHHVGDTPLGLQLRFGNSEAVAVLLERGANPNRGLLKFMPTDKMANFIPLLLQHGWDINEGNGSQTLLHHDTAHGHTNKIRILLAHGADPNARNSNGRTALHLLAASGRGKEAIGLLLEAGARPDATDNDGLTPRDLAQSANSSTKIIDLLT